MKELLESINNQLGESVKAVRVSGRLTDSISCLVADDLDIDVRLAQMLSAHGSLNAEPPRILEINPDHVVVKNLINTSKSMSQDHFNAVANLFLDQARIAAGESLPDPAGFASRLAQVLEKSPDNVWLCLENSAGMGAHIGSSFREIGRILRVVDHPNLKVCLDTEHCFAAGYNLAVPEELDKVIAEFDSEIGLDKLVAVHANDAKVELGSGVDRHEHIGEGYIGISGFESILGNAAFKNVPFFLEVPGFDGNGPDKENLDRLKTIRSSIYDE